MEDSFISAVTKSSRLRLKSKVTDHLCMEPPAQHKDWKELPWTCLLDVTPSTKELNQNLSQAVALNCASDKFFSILNLTN